jgi:MFS family permease
MFASSMPLPRTARIAVSNFFFISGLCFATWAARIPDIQHHLGLNDAGLGSVLFAMPVGSMICLPLAGWLVTRFGSRSCMLIGSFLYTSLLCMLGLADTVWELVIILFFYGMAGNMMNISVNTQAVGVEALYKRSIMASFHGLWSLAGFTGAAIGTLMVSQSVSPIIHFICVTALIIFAVILFFRFSLKQDEQGDNNMKSWFVLPDRSLINLGILAFCCMGCEGCMFDWSGIYFRDVVHAPQHLITVGYTTFMATMATGRFIADYMVTRFGVTRVLQLSGCLITSGLMLAVIFPDFYVAAFGFFLTGFGVSSVVPLAYGLAGKSKTMSTGMAIAAVSTVGFLGFLLGPPVIGYIAKASNLRWSFALMAILGFGTALLASKAKVSE